MVPEPHTDDLQVPNVAIIDIDSDSDLPVDLKVTLCKKHLSLENFCIPSHLSPLLHHRHVNLSIRATFLLGKSYPDMVN